MWGFGTSFQSIYIYIYLTSNNLGYVSSSTCNSPYRITDLLLDIDDIDVHLDSRQYTAHKKCVELILYMLYSAV